MSEFVAPFDVPSKLTDEAYHVRFSHLWNGIATRHSDTIDTKFFVDGRAVVVGLAHTGFEQFHALRGRDLTDREGLLRCRRISARAPRAGRRAPALRRFRRRRAPPGCPARHPLIRLTLLLTDFVQRRKAKGGAALGAVLAAIVLLAIPPAMRCQQAGTVTPPPVSDPQQNPLKTDRVF